MIRNKFLYLSGVLVALLFQVSCDDSHVPQENKPSVTASDTGTVRIIPISTPKGEMNIFTKKFGNNDGIKLLLLAGGPGCSHEYWECMEDFLPKENIEFIYYDQLGCGYSDNPDDTSMWDLPRYVEELEQVRKALGLNEKNFYLLGHSWGGILALEYALKYQNNLKGLIISNMMCSAPLYDRYAAEVLAPQMPKLVVDSIRMLEATGKTDNPRYMGLLEPYFYDQHICRIPHANWPEPIVRSFAKINSSLYVTMQGPSEFGISGKLENWDVSKRLPEIKTRTLTIGATHDTMDPEHMRWMSTQVANGEFLLCPNGSHMSMWDDQQTYMQGLISFLKK